MNLNWMNKMNAHKRHKRFKLNQTIKQSNGFLVTNFKREQDAHHGNGWFFMHHVSSHRPITSCCRRAYVLTNVINCHMTVSHDVQMMSNISWTRHMTHWRPFQRCFTSSCSFHRLKQCSISYTVTIGDSRSLMFDVEIDALCDLTNHWHEMTSIHVLSTRLDVRLTLFERAS